MKCYEHLGHDRVHVRVESVLHGLLECSCEAPQLLHGLNDPVPLRNPCCGDHVDYQSRVRRLADHLVHDPGLEMRRGWRRQTAPRMM